MEKLNLRLKRTSDIGIFHDTRNDVRLLAKVFNAVHDKVNELIDKNKELEKEIEILKKEKV